MISQELVRRFWCDTYLKLEVDQEKASKTEAAALKIIKSHPEFFDELQNTEDSVKKLYGEGESNPFFHLSLHLAVQEQVETDMPEGVHKLFGDAMGVFGAQHAAEHLLMECMQRELNKATQNGAKLSVDGYLQDIEQSLSRAL
jgi:hypothetical protein